MLLGLGANASAQSPGNDTERPPTDDERPTDRAASAHDHLLDEPEVPAGPLMPMRIIGSLGGGLSFRGVRDRNFTQSWYAPSFLELAGTFVFPGRGVWRHGVGLTISTNLTGDGNLSVGMDPLQQFTFMPAYVAYLRLSDDFVVQCKGGLLLNHTFNENGDNSLGFEIGASLAYMLTAGAGLYVQVSGDMFFGTGWSTHPILAASGGIVVDYEVLQ